MKKLNYLDLILFIQFILFLILWTIDQNINVELLKKINGIVFVILFFINVFITHNDGRAQR